MKYFFSLTIFGGGILAFYFAFLFLKSKERKYIENKLFTIGCIASGVWSFGFGILLLQTDPEGAYLCRAVGMVGTLLFLITAQMMVCQISEIRKELKYFYNGFASLGIFIYFLTIDKDVVVYHLEEIGMTYYFKPGLNNNLYTAYTVILSFNILCVTFYMVFQSKVKRIQAFGRRIMIVALVVVFGMVLDTIFPLLGLSAIPGSSVTQFWGLAVLYSAINAINKSKITIGNMSEFIYYSLAMPVLVFDSDYNIQIMNDAASDFLQMDRGQAAEKKIGLGQLFDVEEEKVFHFTEKRMDIDAVCLENQVYCSLAVSKIDDVYGDIIGYIIIVTDLSERVKTMQKLEEATREAETANQAKSTFLANMSHEIRTPMNVIIGFSELVLNMKLDQEMREYMEDIKSASNNLLAIINDILDISKIESGKMELICDDYYTANLFNDVFLIIDAQAKKKGLEFSMEIPPEIPNKLYGDKIRIRGILINLLNNAVKYTQRGQVALQVKEIQKEGDSVTLEFKVSDTGDGIRPEEQGRLFESFSQTDKKLHYGVEGSGLGLAIVKGYVTLMGGTVSVDSVYGEGSVFTVALEQKIVDGSPLDKSYAKENDAASDYKMGQIRISGVRVLIVDDNAVNLKVASRSMVRYGIEVDSAMSGAEAVELCKNNLYQIVFLDQMMPEMDGIEAMKRIRKISPYYETGGTCKMIVLTANVISGVRNQLMQEGFDEFLGKPLNFRRLEQLLIQFLPEECISRLDENIKQQNEDSSDSESSMERSEALPMELEKLQEMLPEVEISKGMANCGGELETYLQILQLVYREGEEKLKELRDLKEQKDYKNYTIRAHAMKGEALNLGAVELSELAKRQEMAGKESNDSYINAHMEELTQAYHLLLQNIASVLKYYHMAEDQKEKNDFGEEEVKQILKEIRDCIEEFDYAGASGLIRNTGKRKLPEQYEQIFSQLSVWMEAAEEKKILEWIGGYLGEKENA